MVSSLLSLALDQPVVADVAMTGEITLTGKVLGVGGIKEKLLAARQARHTCAVCHAACFVPAPNKETLLAATAGRPTTRRSAFRRRIGRTWRRSKRITRSSSSSRVSRSTTSLTSGGCHRPAHLHRN